MVSKLLNLALLISAMGSTIMSFIFANKGNMADANFAVGLAVLALILSKE